MIPTVTGAAADAETGLPVYSVEHTAGANTAFVTVTVADDSMENVSITVNDSIKDIAGNALIEATDNLQTVDTVNPSTTNAHRSSVILMLSLQMQIMDRR